MDVEFRYFEDCPNWQEAVADLETALGDAGWSGEITMTRVETAEAAD